MTDLTFAAPIAARFVPNSGALNCNPRGVPFWTLVAEDLRTNDGDFFSQGFWALFWHRFGNWRMSIRPKALRAPCSLIYKIMFKLCQWWGGIMLPYTVKVGRRVRLDHFGGMVLVAQSIGDDVVIRQNTTFGIARLDRLEDRPVIGNGVEVGAGAVIVGAIVVGDGAVIGANAVVRGSIPANAVAAGVPARVLRIRDCADPLAPVSVSANAASRPVRSSTGVRHGDNSGTEFGPADRRRRHRA